MKKGNGAKGLATSRAAKPKPTRKPVGKPNTRSDYSAPSKSAPTKLLFTLKERPELRADPRAVMLLAARTDQTNGRPMMNTATKVFDAEGKKTRTRKPTWFAPFVAVANGIEELSSVLIEVSHDSSISVIRGAVKGEYTDCETVRRRKNENKPKRTDDGRPHFEDTPRFWFLVDLDGVPEPIDFNWLEDPRRGAIWAVETYLPEPLRRAAFHFAYSSQAGMKRDEPGLRLHLWFYLQQPADSDSLYGYFEQFAAELEVRHRAKVLDLRLFDAVQFHFNAHPVFANPSQDPLAGRERQGLVVDGRAKAVSLPRSAPAATGATAAAPSGPSSATDAMLAEDEGKGLTGVTGYDNPTLDELRAMMPAVIKGYMADRGHTLWRKLSTALKHYLMTVLNLPDEEAFAFVDAEFSRKAPDYKDQMEEENRRQWESFRIDLPPSNKKGGQPTIGTIIGLASNNGYQCRRSAKRDGKSLDQIATEWVYCGDLKRYRSLETGQLWDKEQMTDEHGFVRVEGKWVGSGQFLLHSQNGVQKVARPTYEPGNPERIVRRDGVLLLNTWKPGPILSGPGDVSVFLDHAAYIIPDERERNLLLDAMAYIVQNRGSKMQFAILVYGKQGTGKSWLAEVLMLILGFHNCTEVENDELHNEFNDWILNKELVVVNEMMARGRQDLMNKLKPYITQSVLRVNTKGVPRYECPIPANFFLSSNHEDAIIIDDDDRRYMVLESPAERRPDAYYRALWAWSGEKVRPLTAGQAANIAAVAAYLQERPLENFDGRGKAPDTVGKRKVIERVRPDLDKWVRDSIRDRDWPFSFDLINIKTIADDKESLPGYLRGVTPHRLGDALRRQGAEDVGYMILPTGARNRIWAIRDVERWRTLSEKVRGFHYDQWSDLLKGVAIPDVDDETVLALANRAREQKRAVEEHRKTKPI